MWLPNLMSLFYGLRLSKKESKRIKQLNKLINHFDFNQSYTLFEIDHKLRKNHILRVKEFRDALIDYEYLVEDLYLIGEYIRMK